MTSEQIAALLLDVADYIDQHPNPSRVKVAQSVSYLIERNTRNSGRLILAVEQLRELIESRTHPLPLERALEYLESGILQKETQFVRDFTIEAKSRKPIRTMMATPEEAEVFHMLLAAPNPMRRSVISKDLFRDVVAGSEEAASVEWLQNYFAQDADILFRFRKNADACIKDLSETNRDSLYAWIVASVKRNSEFTEARMNYINQLADLLKARIRRLEEEEESRKTPAVSTTEEPTRSESA
jgi:hypothetical protein